MKNKVIAIMLFLIVLCGSILWISYREFYASQKTISNKIIRFHVIANSDVAEDQALKLKIRDEVLKYIYPKLNESKNIDESRKIIKKNDNSIKEIAQNVVKKNGYKYSIITKLSHENFPIKTYGNITLPQGNYEAYRIIIGNGQGHNWWCVMFPPLCFTDITKGEVSYKKTEKEMKNVLNSSEYNMVDNTKDNTVKREEIVMKFKSAEILKKICNKVQGK